MGCKLKQKKAMCILHTSCGKLYILHTYNTVGCNMLCTWVQSEVCAFVLLPVFLLCSRRLLHPSLPCFVNLSLAKIYFNMNTAKERDFKENRSRLTVLRRQKKKYRSSCTGYSKDSLKYSPPDQLSASRKCWKLLKTAFPFPLHFSPSFSPAPLCH